MKNFLDESGCKLNKTWVEQFREFYNRSLKSWLHVNGIEIYSTLNEGKSVIAEKFTRT